MNDKVAVLDKLMGDQKFQKKRSSRSKIQESRPDPRNCADDTIALCLILSYFIFLYLIQ
jgi:hypothetical protein